MLPHPTRRSTHLSVLAASTFLCAGLTANAALGATNTPGSVTQQKLSWQAPEGCPDTSEVARAVAQLVARPDAPDEEGTLRIAGLVEPTTGAGGQGFRLRLDTAEGGVPRGSRTFEAATCKDVTDAGVVMIAMLEQTGADASARPVSGGASSVAAVASASEPIDDLPRSAPLRQSAQRWRAGLVPFIDIGTLPTPVPGALATMAWSSASFRVEAGVGGSLPAHGEGRTTVDGRTFGVDALLVLSTLRADMHVVAGRAELAVRAGVDVGVIHAKGSGAWSPDSTGAFWCATAAGPSARFLIGDRVAVGAAVEGLVSLTRPTFSIDRDVLHRPAAMGVRTLLAGEVLF